jgi:ubiquinone/menaquinone biosynthesis C-methylase UbiE
MDHGGRATSVSPAATRGDISAIAYGFMASKALFAALEIGVFTALADGPLAPVDLADRTGLAARRLSTLLHALAGLGLLVRDGDTFGNAPAADRYLVRGRAEDFGDYFRLQVGRQIYPAMLDLDAGIAGTGRASDPMSALLSTPDDARTFTTAQHVGSLAAARVLADRVVPDRLMPGSGTGAIRLLDVGGGSGAFSIALCRRFPTLRATILDFPAVVEVARAYRDEAALQDRIDLVGGNAVSTPWPSGQQVVLMSYLLSALGDEDPGSEVEAVLAKAHDCLEPGGLLVVHDFMLDDAGPGPVAAALWFLQYLAYQPDATSFSAAELSGRLCGAGFDPQPGTALIPGVTTVILARKQVDR